LEIRQLLRVRCAQAAPLELRTRIMTQRRAVCRTSSGFQNAPGLESGNEGAKPGGGPGLEGSVGGGVRGRARSGGGEQKKAGPGRILPDPFGDTLARGDRHYAFGRLPWFALFLRRSLRLRPRLLMNSP